MIYKCNKCGKLIECFDYSQYEHLCKECKNKEKTMIHEEDKKEIIILDLKEVLKSTRGFWKDMNDIRPIIALKNAIKYLEEERVK